MGHFNSTQRATSGMRMLKGKTGSMAINKNDLVQVAERGKLWPVKSKTFCETGDVGYIKTTPIRSHALSFNTASYSPGGCLYNATSKLAYAVAGHRSGHNTGQWLLTAFDIEGELQTTISIDNNNFIPRLALLSNNNIALVLNTSIQIYSADLIQLQTVSLPSAANRKVKALTGGGVAIIHSSGSDLYLRIHANDGTAIYVGSSAITATIKDVDSMEIGQLSNGNIVIFYQLADNTFRYTIVSPVGVTVVAPTLLTGITSVNSNSNFSLSTVNGYFCCSVEDDGGYSAVVLTNAGLVRNYRTTLAFGVTLDSLRTPVTTLMTDGVGFWIIAVAIDTASITNNLNKVMVSYISTSGNNSDNKDYILSLDVLGLNFSFTNSQADNWNTTSNVSDSAMAVLQNGVIFLSFKGNRVTFDTNNSAIENISVVDAYDPTLPFLSNSTYTPTRPIIYHYADGSEVGTWFIPFWMLPIGNGNVVMFGGTDSQDYRSHGSFGSVRIFKYVPTAILGIAQSSVADNNENTDLIVNASKGQFLINPIPGDDGGFDFTVTKRRGQKGSFSFDSVIFNDGL